VLDLDVEIARLEGELVKLKQQRAERQAAAFLAAVSDGGARPAVVTLKDLTRIYRQAEATIRDQLQQGIAERQAVTLAAEALIAAGRSPEETARWLRVDAKTVRTDPQVRSGPHVVEKKIVWRVNELLADATSRGLPIPAFDKALDWVSQLPKVTRARRLDAVTAPLAKPRAAKATLPLLPAARRRR